MPDELGLLLEDTWRLHPDICSYTSEVYYERRLEPGPGTELQRLDGGGVLSGTGLRFVAIDHAGDHNESPDEAAAVGAMIRDLLASGPRWTSPDGVEHPVALADVLVITPYNAQVRALGSALPGIRAGTVDKFQGQEAPISIYSMATSSAEDAPRGLEFLYSLHRLNVATSRARCVAVVVASPELIRVRCRTPRQMQLANGLARLVELAVERPGPRASPLTGRSG
jgi:superfamily I DNA and/or RNA helicase